MFYCIFFFFSSRRRHTRFKCDWSSDVCSSDLQRGPTRYAVQHAQRGSREEIVDMAGGLQRPAPEIGRGAGGERGEISGGGGSFKKKKRERKKDTMKYIKSKVRIMRTKTTESVR